MAFVVTNQLNAIVNILWFFVFCIYFLGMSMNENLLSNESSQKALQL